MKYGKKVNQYELNGFELKLINTFNSISDASKYTGINKSGISDVLNGKRNFAGGYFWRFADTKIHPIVYIPNNFPIPIAQIEVYNGLIHNIFPSITEASKVTKINISLISKCLNGYINNTGPWQWKRITDLSFDQICLPLYQNSPYKINKDYFESNNIAKNWIKHDKNFEKLHKK